MTRRRARPGRTPAQTGAATGGPKSPRQHAAAFQTAQAVTPTVSVTATAPPGNCSHHPCEVSSNATDLAWACTMIVIANLSSTRTV